MWDSMMEEKKNEDNLSEISTIKALEVDKRANVLKIIKERNIKLGVKLHFLPDMVDVNNPSNFNLD